MSDSGLPDLEEIFLGDVFASTVPGYSPRRLQVDLAKAVNDAMASGGIHFFEAGTGIGKSMAYIVPAVLSGKKIFVSTATKTLQDQLAGKDVPAVIRALDSRAVVFVLKGRNNYLCIRKWMNGKDMYDTIDEFANWAANTSDGDVSSCSVEPDPSVWRRFRSDRPDCAGNSCRFRGECHFNRARNRARKADILILNHHLLVSGLSGGDVLPGADVLVIDEGHRLEDAAAECLGLSLGENTLLPIFDGIAFSELKTVAKAELLEAARELSGAVAVLTTVPAGDGEVLPWRPGDHLEAIASVEEKARTLLAAVGDDEELAPVAGVVSHVLHTAVELADLDEGTWCCFIETGGRYPVIRAVPPDMGPMLREVVYSGFDTVVLTSATLTVAGRFEFFKERLGAPEACCRSFGSPFDYSRQAALSVPRELPPPDSHEKLARVTWKWGKSAAEALGGRTLLLFTSYRNLRLVRDLAAEDPPEKGLRLLVQGEMSRNVILDEFRNSCDAIILGTASFWEGVDLPGNMLQVVIIDRLPFASPGHPLVMARMELIEKRGGSSFTGYSLPLAVVRLKQGVGRLIRTGEDRGVVMIMDRRIRDKGYGKVFLASIPPFRMVDENEALDFIRNSCVTQVLNGRGGPVESG